MLSPHTVIRVSTTITGCATIPAHSRRCWTTSTMKMTMAIGSCRRSRRYRIACLTKWWSASRSVMSRRPGVETAIDTGTSMSQGTNTPSISGSRYSAPSGKSGKRCWMPTSGPRTASFIPWAGWPCRRITPLWRWRKITSRGVSMACDSATWSPGTGIPRCSITSPPILSGPTTQRRSTTLRSMPPRCTPFRSGGIR